MVNSNGSQVAMDVIRLCSFTASENDLSVQIVTTQEVWINLKEKLELKENGESKVLQKSEMQKNFCFRANPLF